MCHGDTASCFLETFPVQQCYTVLCITALSTCLTTSAFSPFPHTFTWLIFPIHSMLAHGAVLCSLCLLPHHPTVEERNALQPVPHSQQAHLNYRMGSLAGAAKLFPSWEKDSSSHAEGKKVKNQKQKLTISNITLNVTSSFVLKKLPRSLISEKPVKFVVVQPHRRLTSVMILSSDFTCSTLSLQPSPSAARRGWEPDTGRQKQVSFVMCKNPRYMKQLEYFLCMFGSALAQSRRDSASLQSTISLLREQAFILFS